MQTPVDQIQIGGTHYKTWTVQPYKLMVVMNGAQSHILSYLLRTKGEDDLLKASHWCDLMLHDMQYLQDNIEATKSLRKSIMQEWIVMNNLDSDELATELLTKLAVQNYSAVKKLINTRIEHGLGGITCAAPSALK